MKPTHPQAPAYATSGLFDGLSTFHDLEQRIASLETPQERGDAFEVFVEACLATQSIYLAKAIWTKTVPLAIRTELQLPSSDEGYDGVLQRLDGTCMVYQAKFRTQRVSLTWTELSTFIGITDSAPVRFLFTNTDAVAKTARTRPRFQRVCGYHFDGLEAEDFSRLHTWLNSGIVDGKVKDPYPHNQCAVKAITEHWQHHERGQVLMACGTGKTLVGLWAAEQLGANRVLVLVPSLILLKQTLEEWARNTHWKGRFQYICVCSDPSVSRETDAIRMDPSEVGFRVDTDPTEVRRFLTLRSRAVKVVFATYHSTKVVAEGSKGLPPFDLGIFDEAHKTTGRVGTRFTWALRDDQLPITKRLFFTATPRHYDVSRRTKEGEHRAVFSMDDENTYGRIAHRLSFAKAAAEGIICPYKIIISVIDHKTITNELLNRGEVIVEDDPVWAKHVAGQIALRQAVQEYPIKRIITFHTRPQISVFGLLGYF